MLYEGNRYKYVIKQIRLLKIEGFFIDVYCYNSLIYKLFKCSLFFSLIAAAATSENRELMR